VTRKPVHGLGGEDRCVVDNTTGAVVIQSTRNDDAGWLDETLQLLQTLSNQYFVRTIEG
jgi:hypothetical protein